MKVTSFLFEQVLKNLGVPPSAIQQLTIVGTLGDVEGRGFPEELFLLSAPMITRGLLNFAILQMKRDWVFPFWVHKQLNPTEPSFIPRSQNPLLVNVTHRNWTMVGSPNGYYEAIVDPRGVMTPLPREWSVDVYLMSDAGILFPSFNEPSAQEYNTKAPLITTTFQHGALTLTRETFVDTVSKGIDVVFESVTIRNTSNSPTRCYVGVAVRPFNPEGVAPITSITWKTPRFLIVDQSIGVVFNQEPTAVVLSNAQHGDLATRLKNYQSYQALDHFILNTKENTESSVRCPLGLCHAVCFFQQSLQPHATGSVYWSVALEPSNQQTVKTPKSTWRVSYYLHRQSHLLRWKRERSKGASITFENAQYQQLFDANVLFLLQLHDDEFVSPGPYLYHRFWFRDAVPMLHALNRLGYAHRTHHTVEAFRNYLQSNGFFKGPDGEWDSNGAVLWFLHQHYRYSHKTSWLKNIFPLIISAAEWIITKRNETQSTPTTHKGLLPPSLSAEHLGTVDQYYWDSFWSYAGLRAACELATELNQTFHAQRWSKELSLFESDLQASLTKVQNRLGKPVIPASPSRSFDEGAIGSLCGIYPLSIHNSINAENFITTAHECSKLYCTDKGFYHPFIHSGYNPYLTLQLAHSFLYLNDSQRAWDIATTIFQQCTQPYALPEAIHPRTGGGAMGDGNHGWAAAEIILFLLDCLVFDTGVGLKLFPSPGPLLSWGQELSLTNIPTPYGTFSCNLEYHSEQKGVLKFTIEEEGAVKPDSIEINFPFQLTKVLSSPSGVLKKCTNTETGTTCSIDWKNTMLVFER